MKRTFKIEFIKKHLVIYDKGNTIVVDTGNPLTIHTANTLYFMDKQYQVTTNMMGNSIDTLKAMAKVEFTTLLGLDILAEYKIILDYQENQITFCTHDEVMPEGNNYPIECGMGAITIPITARGKNLNMILDTGATLSYVDSNVTYGMESKETMTDFSPLIGGKFSTKVYEIESSFYGEKFNCRYGNLPYLIANMVNTLGANGVIGYDFLSKFKMVLDIRNRKLTII
jgi:hypothetical protein